MIYLKSKAEPLFVGDGERTGRVFVRSLRGYPVALAAVLACLLVRLWLEPVLGERLPFSLFIIPVVLAAWLGGRGPALTAMVLSVGSVFWFFIAPRYHEAHLAAVAWVATAAYVATSLLICWFSERSRRLHHEAKQGAERINAQQIALESEIAERRRAEQALLASEKWRHAVIEAIPQLVWTASPDGVWTYANEQWERYTGESAAQSLAKCWLGSVHPEDRERVLASWRGAFEGGTTVEYDFRLRNRDGSYGWFKNRAVPLREPEGQIIKWFGACTDITSMVEARETLTRSHDELKRLVLERTAEVEQLKNKLQEENAYLREKVQLGQGRHRLVGQTPAIQRVLQQVAQVAPTDATVMLLGETGTGKELLAAAVHEFSPRRTRTLVKVNCAAMPSPLVESELFGREKGAFTGSLSRQIGRFELAEGSTILLDEIGELSLEVQAKLLRTLESRQIERLGNPKPIPVNVRIIAATNRDLDKAIGEGKFRQDLYYRLNVFPISLPPLRERREDIPLLVWAFVDEFAKTFNKNIESVERESMDALQRYAWPGNVRELRNLIERAIIVADGPKLRIQLPSATSSAASTVGRKMDEVEREHMLQVLEKSGWRIRGVNGAAERLGLKPTTLEARMVKLGIRRPGAEEPAV